MPLSEHDAKVIISKSKQSPFGKGNETRVDTSVRRSWELDATQILTRNPLWDATMRDLITTVHKDLALTCGAQDVSAQLYKLLLYEPGAFFKPHQDTEKVPGMFGTLVVSLPSLHRGGDLVLCHNEETIEYKTSNFSEFGSSYAAWYSNVTHEVKPVVSGYRLILTYNLVRLNNAQAYAPLAVTNQKARLLPILDLWDSSLNGGKTLLPPYLIHKLEHQYTQASLKMARLQGRDLSQVQFLQTVCDRIGFGLYLAQMERMVVKDDYGDDNEYERDANLRHIQELEGRKLIERLYLQEDNTLEDLDDDDHDESEHGGYTGNEGAQATYWYRDTVVIIVPSCRKGDFLFQGSSPHESIHSYLRVLGSSAQDDPIQKNRFVRLAQMMVSSGTRWIVGQYATREEKRARQENQEFVAMVSIQLGQFDLYDRVVSTVTANPPSIECARELGLALQKHGLDVISPSIDQALQAAKTFEAKHSIWTSFNHVVRHSCQAGSIGTSNEIEVYLRNSLNGIIQLRASLSKGDGSALADVMSAHGTDAFIQDQLLPRIAKSSTPTKVGFAYRFLSLVDVGDLSESRKALAVTVLESLWQDFTFDSGVAAATTTLIAYARLINPVDDHGLFITGNEIWVLIGKSKEILPDFDLDRVCEQLCSGIDVASINSLRHTVLPLVELIVAHETSPFSNPEHGPSESGKILVMAAIERLIRSFIGKEPRFPNTWTQPTGGCGNPACRDCAGVNAFLADPRKQVGEFPCAKMRRLHLHKCFTDHKDRSYTVETHRGTSPNVWVITKNVDGFKKDYAAWKTRFEHAADYMVVLGRSRRLELYLGPDFEALTSLRVENLPLRRQAAVAAPPPLALSASAPNVQSRKRPLEDDADVGNRGKRVFSKVLNGLGEEEEVEVVDLT